MVFCILVRFLSFFTIVFIFYLLVIFPSQTRIRVNIKVVRCLEYSASLVFTQSVLRRNSDNNGDLYMPRLIISKYEATSNDTIKK